MPRTNKSKHALLALLSMGPRSGYDMQRDIQRTIGHFWSESYGQIYPALRSIVDEGLATVKTEEQDGRPDRKIYTITAKGQKALCEWLETPPEPPPLRNEILLKFFVGWQTSHETLVEHVSRLRAHFGEQQQRLNAIEAFLRQQAANNDDALFWLITVRSGQLYTRARLEWCRETLTLLARFERTESNTPRSVAARTKLMARIMEASPEVATTEAKQ